MPEPGATGFDPGPRGHGALAFEDRDFRRVVRLIHERAGIHLGPHKRDMVYSRLARRVRALGLQRFSDYIDRLESDDGEGESFVNALTTNLTSFFREDHHFDALAGRLRALAGASVSIWCCAASTGEEAYSIAMVACEAFGSMAPPVRILATDIDTDVLQVAAKGIYPSDRLAPVSADRRRRFFLRGEGPHAGHCRVKPALQRLVTFRPLNLLSAGYGLRGGFHAVFCRNVMIYFDKPTQRDVLLRIVPLLAPGGILFTGHSESFNHALDVVLPCGRTMYRAAAHAGDR
jgi:chemotaxis protein methyltransferase CheR